MYRGHMYVPKDPQLCHDIVHAHHDSVMTGHLVEETGAGLPQFLVAGHLLLCCQLCGRVQCLQLLQVLPDVRRRWGSLPQTRSQPATERLSLLTPLENCQSLKDTMPSL